MMLETILLHVEQGNTFGEQRVITVKYLKTYPLNKYISMYVNIEN